MRTRQRGFTLIELMVVVAVIGVLIALSISLSAQTDGANAQTVSDQVVSQMQFARQRAVSTRRYHRVHITPTQIIIKEGLNSLGAVATGMVAPASYREIQEMTLPIRVTFWDASHSVYPTAPAAGAPSSANAGLSFDLTIKPDGSSDGLTAFLTDQNVSRRERIIVYTVTGSAYARQAW